MITMTGLRLSCIGCLVENPEGTIVYEHVTMFYFLLDQSPVKEPSDSCHPLEAEG